MAGEVPIVMQAHAAFAAAPSGGRDAQRPSRRRHAIQLFMEGHVSALHAPMMSPVGEVGEAGDAAL